MRSASAGRGTVKRSFKPRDKITISARQVKHGEEDNENDSTETSFSFVSALKACAKRKDLYQGIRIHVEIRDSGLLEKSTYLRNTLISMYAKCGALSRAQQVLDGLPVRNVISWNALIAGYAQQGQGKEALSCFYRMRRDGLSPDATTYACILKACSITQNMDMGNKIHNEIVSQGLLKNNVVLGSTLVDMYAKCGALLKAQKVLEQLPVRDIISWTALIARYVQQGHGQEALSCFHRMQSDGLSPNAITYSCILKACSITQDVDMGKRIHDEIVSQGLLKSNIVLGTALVDMYAKCGALLKAQRVLEQLPVRDVISWNALIAGYAEQGQSQEVLGCFQRMQRDRLSPDAFTYTCILKACSITQAMDMGERIHDELVSQGLLKNDVVLGTALVDMYAKCGALLKAQKVLEQLPERNVISWTALIVGYAEQGQGQEALRCFRRMQSEGLTPDATTFSSVLNACSHSGLVDEGEMFFNNMREKYGVAPDKEHYTCMVDLFGRARLFSKAMRVIKMMPSSDHLPVWSALLGACRKWGNVDLGRLAFEHAIQLDKCNAAWYVLMSNIYAAAGMQEEAQNIESMRTKNAARM